MEVQNTILLVDDSEVTRRVIRDSLIKAYQSGEIEVFLKENGNTALEWLYGRVESEDSLPNLIITDRYMPEMDGDEFTRILKSNPNFKDIPVLMLTIKNENEDIIEGLKELGADDYITKPFDIEVVTVRISNLLRLYSHRKESIEKNSYLENKVSNLNTLIKSSLNQIGFLGEVIRFSQNVFNDSQEAFQSILTFLKEKMELKCGLLFLDYEGAEEKFNIIDVSTLHLVREQIINQNRIHQDESITIVTVESLSVAVFSPASDDQLLDKLCHFVSIAANKIKELFLLEKDRERKGIKEILETIEEGFLTFDESLIVDNEYSSQCKDFFRIDIKGKNILKLLFNENTWIETKQNISKERVKELMHLCFENEKNIELIQELLPAEIKIFDKHFQLVFRIFKGLVKQKRKMMLSLKNITFEKKLLNEKRVEQERNNLLIKGLLNKNSFLIFIKDMQEMLNEVSEESLQAPIKELDLKVLLNRIHAIKGNLSQFGLNHIANDAHQLESLVSLVDAGKVFFDDDVRDRIYNKSEAIRNEFTKSIDRITELIPFFEGTHSEKSYQIPYNKLSNIKDFIFSKVQPDLILEFEERFEELVKEPLGPILENYESHCYEVAHYLRKKVDVELTGKNLEVNHEKYRQFFVAIEHILRNSIDHGIETPEEREMLNKEKGLIKINANVDGKKLQIEVEDDGRGINVEKIKEEVLSKGLKKESEINELSQQDLLQFMFLHGISTKEESTFYSGKGVGLDIVKEIIDEIGGEIQIETEIGKGTKFTLSA